MSGDEPLGYGHTDWPSPEESLTTNENEIREMPNNNIATINRLKDNSMSQTGIIG